MRNNIYKQIYIPCECLPFCNSIIYIYIYIIISCLTIMISCQRSLIVKYLDFFLLNLSKVSSKFMVDFNFLPVSSFNKFFLNIYIYIYKPEKYKRVQNIQQSIGISVASLARKPTLPITTLFELYYIHPPPKPSPTSLVYISIRN